MDNRTGYNENNSRYAAYDGGNNNFYSGNNGYGNGMNNNSYYGNGNNGDIYGAGSSFDSTYSNEETESKVLTRSFIVMFVSLLVTALMATVVAVNKSLFEGMINSYGIFIIIELAVVFGATFAVKKKNVVVAGILYTMYTVINGMTLSIIFYAYDLGSVQEIFLMTAVLFAVMAVIGATTNINLSKIGGICTMFLVGGLIVTFANILFLHSTGIELALDYIMVAVFIGFTAYDTQRLKVLAREARNDEVNVIAILCGMELYLDFINLFLRLLAIFGKRRN